METKENQWICYVGCLGSLTADICRFDPTKINNYRSRLEDFDQWMSELIATDPVMVKEFDLKLLQRTSRLLCGINDDSKIGPLLLRKIVRRNIKFYNSLSEQEKETRQLFIYRIDLEFISWKNKKINDYEMVRNLLRWKNATQSWRDPHYLLLMSCACACIIKYIETKNDFVLGETDQVEWRRINGLT